MTLELFLILLHWFQLSNQHIHALRPSPPGLRAVKVLQTTALSATPQALCVVYVVNNMQ